MPRAGSAAKRVPTLHMRERDPSDEVGEIAVTFRPQNQVPVVWHEAPGQNAHRVLLLCRRKDPLERQVVTGGFEDGAPTIRPIERVINDAARCLPARPPHIILLLTTTQEGKGGVQEK